MQEQISVPALRAVLQGQEVVYERAVLPVADGKRKSDSQGALAALQAEFSVRDLSLPKEVLQAFLCFAVFLRVL